MDCKCCHDFAAIQQGVYVYTHCFKVEKTLSIGTFLVPPPMYVYVAKDVRMTHPLSMSSKHFLTVGSPEAEL